MSSQQASWQEEWYRVYKPELDTAAFDPLDPVKRYHEGIFVELNAVTGSGTLFHVTGDVIGANGMRYEERENVIEKDSIHLHAFPQVGWVLKADFESGRISTILQALPRPTKQQGINFWEVDPITGRHEIIWTRQDGERYGPGEQQRPIFKCNEWTHQYAIPALRDAGILHDSASVS
ncbi:uncharacterized protein GIQ15_00110 [Arthroderma uncinatum]|uniref:uncharacterized protein n=1 Tax=Arthroderma uncinatum TaxID=74035 RepID=UPI00144A8741|nr:uncharacterized protein GIQ15_00110 [Arthroderma uncinatum]KAF3490593.1 hypothetical protein GIQ15_00110 [Arthroderma uncinatum]